MNGRDRQSRRNRPDQQHWRRGFTLLEVMVALGILAMVMAAVMSANGTMSIHGARVYNMTTATQLANSIVLNLEEEYRLDGFPTNNVEGRDCDVPDGFDHFDCEYDLITFDVGDQDMDTFGSDTLQQITDSPLMGALCGGGPGAAPAADPSAALQDLNMQSAALGALKALLDPQFAALCGIKLQVMCQNVPMITSFIPRIIEQAAKSTRKLNVRISWRETGSAEKTLEIETFLTSVPHAEDEDEGAAP